jgi:hypothetical protein
MYGRQVGLHGGTTIVLIDPKVVIAAPPLTPLVLTNAVFTTDFKLRIMIPNIPVSHS